MTARHRTIARFQPTCVSRQFSNCTNQQIVNSYDNTILYTDHVLAELIEMLRGIGVKGFDTAMIYVSDHGESLGEKGLYLHGMPRAQGMRGHEQRPCQSGGARSREERAGCLADVAHDAIDQEGWQEGRGQRCIAGLAKLMGPIAANEDQG